MRQLGKLLLCGLVFGGFIGSSLLVNLMFCCLSLAKRQHCAIVLTQFWARVLLRLLGLKIRAPQPLQHFSLLPAHGCLVVSNHQSYLDIVVLVAHLPVQFVAKLEVSHWPVIGLMAKLAGTIFIDRSSSRQSVRCAGEIAVSLQQGGQVLVFPEGTSTNGCQVLPFKPMLMNAALQARVPVLPLTLHYDSINEQPLTNEKRACCCWYGEMDFVSHFWRVLALKQIGISLEVHPMLNPPHSTTAQELARLAHEKVARRFIAPPTTTSTTENLDTANEFLLGAVLLSLINHETNYLKESEYGEA